MLYRLEVCLRYSFGLCSLVQWNEASFTTVSCLCSDIILSVVFCRVTDNGILFVSMILSIGNMTILLLIIRHFNTFIVMHWYSVPMLYYGNVFRRTAVG